MPKGGFFKTELDAVEIVRQEERANGWTPAPALTKRREREEGCDFFSSPPGGAGDPHPIEVKGRSESLFWPDGRPRARADINAEQLARARRDQNWRLEIVANLAAARLGVGTLERLTLTAAEVCELAVAWKYRLNLEGLEDRVREG